MSDPGEGEGIARLQSAVALTGVLHLWACCAVCAQCLRTGGGALDQGEHTEKGVGRTPGWVVNRGTATWCRVQSQMDCVQGLGPIRLRGSEISHRLVTLYRLSRVRFSHVRGDANL